MPHTQSLFHQKHKQQQYQYQIYNMTSELVTVSPDLSLADVSIPIKTDQLSDNRMKTS